MKALLIFLLSLSSVFCNYYDLNQAFINVAKNQSETIVSIVSTKTEKVNNMFFFNPFEDFDFGQDPYQQEREAQSLGSGVIINKNDGYIITNNHVIEGAEEVKVVLYDKREIDAEIVATDPLSDIAVIKIEANNLTNALPGNSDNIQIGEWVMAIGSPFGLHLNHTVTAGIISAKGRSDVVSRLNFENFIQHDAAINPGNSGGGLFNLKGELIGINTAIATDGFSRSNAGVGFAVPINQVMRVVNDLISEGKVLRGWLGVKISPIDEDMKNALNLESKEGALVSEVIKDSPADLAGLQAKDIITGMNSINVSDVNELRNKVSNAKPGEIIIFNIVRNKTQQNIMVTLGLRPNQENVDKLFSEANKSSYDLLGLKVETNDDNGVIIIDIDPKSNAYAKNIRKGDIITEVGNETINTYDEYILTLEKYNSGDAIMIRIISNGNARYDAFEIN